MSGVSAHPNGLWVAPQARYYLQAIEEREEIIRHSIDDYDGKLTSAFDAVFQSKQISVIHPPPRSTQCYSFAERWVRSVRQETLDHA